jgi:hypothetical protein
LHLQGYFADYPTPGIFAAGEQLNVHIPATNRVQQRAIRTIARYKNELNRQFLAKGDYDG